MCDPVSRCCHYVGKPVQAEEKEVFLTGVIGQAFRLSKISTYLRRPWWAQERRGEGAVITLPSPPELGPAGGEGHLIPHESAAERAYGVP